MNLPPVPTSHRRKMNSSSRKLIGEILLEAGLISHAQLKIALAFQRQRSQFKLGEIIAAQGWLKQKTIDFLVDISSPAYDLKYAVGQPIGYYLQQAELLNSEQINIILEVQKKLGVKFCYLAVIKGFIKPETAEFFVNNVVNKVSPASFALQNKNNDGQINTSLLEINRFSEQDNDLYEEITKEQDIYVDSNVKNSSADININDLDIEFSPMWIDQ